jgi:protein-S-isoprenylcysteine O-methyltransferase Ste14
VPPLVVEAVNIICTGIAVWLAIRWWHNPVGLGIAIALAVYYYRLLWRIPREELRINFDQKRKKG